MRPRSARLFESHIAFVAWCMGGACLEDAMGLAEARRRRKARRSLTGRSAHVLIACLSELCVASSRTGRADLVCSDPMSAGDIHRHKCLGLYRMSITGTVRGQREIRSVGIWPEQGRSRLGFGRFSLHPAAILVAENIFDVPMRSAGSLRDIEHVSPAKIGAGKTKNRPNPSLERRSCAAHAQLTRHSHAARAPLTCRSRAALAMVARRARCAAHVMPTCSSCGPCRRHASLERALARAGRVWSYSLCALLAAVSSPRPPPRLVGVAWNFLGVFLNFA